MGNQAVLQRPSLIILRTPFCIWNKQQACSRSSTSSQLPSPAFPLTPCAVPIWDWSWVPVGRGHHAQSLGSQCYQKQGGQAQDKGQAEQDCVQGSWPESLPSPPLISGGSFKAGPVFWSSRVTEGVGRSPHKEFWGLDWLGAAQGPCWRVALSDASAALGIYTHGHI